MRGKILDGNTSKLVTRRGVAGRTASKGYLLETQTGCWEGAEELVTKRARVLDGNTGRKSTEKARVLLQIEQGYLMGMQAG